MNTRSAVTSRPLGYNSHGNKTTLFAQRQGDGAMAYTIRIEPRTIHEQPQTVAGLTAANLRALGVAAEQDGV